MRLSTLFSSAAACTLISASPLFAANMLLNPGFEAGSGTVATNWTQIENPDTANTQSAADRVETLPHSGVASMRLSYSNSATPPGSNTEIQQVTPTGSIAPGQSYDFSFWGRRVGELGTGTVVFAQVLFLDSDGSAGGGVKGGSPLYQPDLTESYQQFSFTNILAPLGSDAAQISIRLAGGAVANSAATIHVDDVSFAAVPEPASLGLLALGAPLMMKRRRRA